jgi:hypothetical protein
MKNNDSLDVDYHTPIIGQTIGSDWNMLRVEARIPYKTSWDF